MEGANQDKSTLSRQPHFNFLAFHPIGEPHQIGGVLPTKKPPLILGDWGDEPIPYESVLKRPRDFVRRRAMCSIFQSSIVVESPMSAVLPQSDRQSWVKHWGCVADLYRWLFFCCFPFLYCLKPMTFC